MNESLRERRIALGLSQAQLASATGLTRQQISAVESGRHSPSVAAAIALAAALDRTVESLFGPQTRLGWEPVTGSAPIEGTPVRAARVGERPVYAPLPAAGLGSGGWTAPDGIFTGGEVETFDGQVPDGVVVAGCDPVLSLAEELLPASGPSRLLAVHATSVAAARALHRDRVHAALVHGSRERLAAATPRSRSIRLASWRVGVAGPTSGALDLEAIARGKVRIAHRPPGAESERSLRSALGQTAGTVNLTGPVATGHVEAMLAVELGAADVGLTMEPVARAHGFEFHALEEHEVELRVDVHWADHPGIVALVDLFGSERLKRRVATLPEYRLQQR